MLKLEYGPIHEERLKEIGGNEQLLEELSEKLRLWLNQQLHLPQNISDRQLKFFIYAAKFNFEKAKKHLDLYYSIRNWIPEIFDDFDPLSPSINQLYKFIQITSIPKLTPEGCRLFISRFTNADISMIDIYAIAKYGLMIHEMYFKENLTDNFTVIIMDLKNLRIKFAEKLTPTLLKKYAIILEAYGIKIKNVYLFNAPTYTDIMLKLIKPVMKAKLFQRIFVFTSGVESLYEKIPRSLFPSDYGGDQPSMDTLTKMWHASLVEQRNWFLQQNELKTDESRRSESSIINPNDLFGVSGTFRKLEID